MVIFHAYAQVEPGTAPDNTTRGITANGLTQLYSVTGKYILSADGAGGYPLASYNVSVNKPSAAATVFKAFMMATPTYLFISQIANGCMTLAGSPVNWNGHVINTFGVSNSWADVTSIVAPVIDIAPAGINNLVVTECNTSDIDGMALLVIFADPAAQQRTIIIMFGGLSTTGDNFALTLAQPIDPLAPGALLDMGLGISFGFQGSVQYSIIDVNGSRLTTAAGGADDAVDDPTNGNLITVGGIGDLNTNPVNPFATPSTHRSDDELYSLLPLITNTTTNILVTTSNPSDDDNVLLAYFEISGAAIIGEGILLSQVEDTNCVGTQHTVTALVQDVTGAPVVGIPVTFTVLAGPNAGDNGIGITNASGIATFSYVGDGGPGIDDIQACFEDSQQQQQCSNILHKVWEDCGPDVPLSNWAIFIGLALILLFAILRFRRF